MQYLIGLIGAVAGLLWAVNSLQKAGLSFNPFAWWRRVQWQNTHGAKPLYKLDNPIDVASVLLVGMAKCRGEVSVQQKDRMRAMFVETFKLSPQEADDLMVSASFLTRDEVYIVDSLEKILNKSMGLLTTDQRASLLNMMRDLSMVEGQPNQEQQKLLDRTLEIFNQGSQLSRGKTW